VLREEAVIISNELRFPSPISQSQGACGKSADLIVVDKNLLAMPVTDIHKIQVLMTFFKGKEIYRMKESPSAKVQTGTSYKLEKDSIAKFREIGYVGANGTL